jgi:hypothetical protein
MMQNRRVILLKCDKLVDVSNLASVPEVHLIECTNIKDVYCLKNCRKVVWGFRERKMSMMLSSFPKDPTGLNALSNLFLQEVKDDY